MYVRTSKHSFGNDGLRFYHYHTEPTKRQKKNTVHCSVFTDAGKAEQKTCHTTIGKIIQYGCIIFRFVERLLPIYFRFFWITNGSDTQSTDARV